MYRSIVILAFVVGCSKPATYEPDQSTPHAAALCQVVAIRTQDLAAWRTCMHPRLRDPFEREIAPRASGEGFWQDMKARVKPLETALPQGFTLGPPSAEMQSYGDRVARIRLGDDSFEVMQLNDRWYVVDTGI